MGLHFGGDITRMWWNGDVTAIHMGADLVWQAAPDTPEPTWVDDFTAPTLHERWTLLDGTYSPPGLTDAWILGPAVDDTFEISINGNVPQGGLIHVALGTPDLEQFPIAVGLEEFLGEMTVYLDTPDWTWRAPNGHTVTLRRTAGMWQVLTGRTVAVGPDGPLEVPDTTTGNLYMTVETWGATLTRITYTDHT